MLPVRWGTQRNLSQSRRQSRETKTREEKAGRKPEEGPFVRSPREERWNLRSMPHDDGLAWNSGRQHSPRLRTWGHVRGEGVNLHSEAALPHAWCPGTGGGHGGQYVLETDTGWTGPAGFTPVSEMLQFLCPPWPMKASPTGAAVGRGEGDPPSDQEGTYLDKQQGPPG